MGSPTHPFYLDYYVFFSPRGFWVSARSRAHKSGVVLFFWFYCFCLVHFVPFFEGVGGILTYCRWILTYLGSPLAFFGGSLPI